MNSCSTRRQIQTASCYDVFTFTTSRCTTIESAVATAAINLTQCVTTTETVSRARFWNNDWPRSGSEDVGRKSAQLLTYVTGEPIYAPTPGARVTVDSTDLPLSAARVAATPADTLDAGNRLPVETQSASVVGTGTTAAATPEDDDTAAQSSVLDHFLLEFGLQALPDGSHSARTRHLLGSPTLPTTPSQLEQVDVLNVVLAITNAASEPRLAQSLPQATGPQTGSAQRNDLEPTNAGYNAKDDTKDNPPPTGTQDAKDDMLPSGDVTSEAFMSSQKNSPDTPMRSKPLVSADDALRPLMFQKPPTATPMSPSMATRTQTLVPGSTLSFGSAHVSVLPDASGFALSDGSTSSLKDGGTAEVKLPDGLALGISRSGTVYLVHTRTADTTPQLTDNLDPVRTTLQIDGDVSLLRGVAEASSGVVTAGSTNAVAAGVSEGAASVCSFDLRALVVGTLLALVCFMIS